MAPDYLLVHRSIKKQLLDLLKSCVRDFFGVDPAQSPDYARIINPAHFDRLEALLADGKVVLGGQRDRDHLYISPTILDEVRMSDAVMKDEIFGPILPVLEYDKLEEAMGIVEQRPAPLSLYVFTRSKAVEDRLFSQLSFGGGCVNDAMVHLTNPYLPFGGIGTSGLGAYHGRYSFETFSHKKSVVSSPFFPEITVKYQPYRDKLRWLKKLMK